MKNFLALAAILLVSVGSAAAQTSPTTPATTGALKPGATIETQVNQGATPTTDQQGRPMTGKGSRLTDDNGMRTRGTRSSGTKIKMKNGKMKGKATRSAM